MSRFNHHVCIRVHLNLLIGDLLSRALKADLSSIQKEWSHYQRLTAGLLGGHELSLLLVKSELAGVSSDLGLLKTNYSYVSHFRDISLLPVLIFRIVLEGRQRCEKKVVELEARNSNLQEYCFP